MFKYKSIREQLREERAKNEQLRSAQAKNASDTEYIAMMCDIDLDIAEKSTEMESAFYESEV